MAEKPEFDTAELRRLMAEATVAPWETTGDLIGRYEAGRPWEMIAAATLHADAALIAAMRNALPALLDTIDALRREAPRWRTDLEAAPYQDRGMVTFVRNGTRRVAVGCRLTRSEWLIEGAIETDVLAFQPLPEPWEGET